MSRESPVAEPQPLLGLPPLGDIFQYGDEEGRLAVRGRPAGDLRADPEKAAVLLTIRPFDVVVSTPPFLQLSQRLPFGFDFIRVREVGQRPPATLLQGKTQQALQGEVAIDQSAETIELGDADRCRVEERPKVPIGWLPRGGALRVTQPAPAFFQIGDRLLFRSVRLCHLCTRLGGRYASTRRSLARTGRGSSLPTSRSTLAERLEDLAVLRIGRPGSHKLSVGEPELAGNLARL